MTYSARNPPNSKNALGYENSAPLPRASPSTQGHHKISFRFGADFVRGDAWGNFDKLHAGGFFLLDCEYAEVGDHHVDDTGPGERQLALVQELGFILGRMLHDDDHSLDAGDKVHGAPHALDHLAGDHPVGEIAILGDLHGAK